jgi:gamma-glutamyltranspeptidase/glutathione hydrolase
LLTAQDMASWQAKFEAPATFNYHGVTVCKTGTWSQGPLILQMLPLLEDFDLASLEPNGADFIHLWVEAAKLAFADGDAFYGDPDFVDVPLTTLLNEDYNAARHKLIDDTASADMQPGTVGGRAGRLPHVATPAGHASVSANRLRWRRREPAIPATSTSSTAGAMSVAAGCKAHRPFPRWVSAL